ncbi:MAG: hypothetical protein FJ190_10860 [Gammaproteobacteria bacterium]|nr:hypothetical protein [Gammaproteobacteria bacterium]
MGLHFDYALRTTHYALRLRSNSVKTPGLYGYAGVVVHRSASLASMSSFIELQLAWACRQSSVTNAAIFFDDCSCRQIKQQSFLMSITASLSHKHRMSVKING